MLSLELILFIVWLFPIIGMFIFLGIKVGAVYRRPVDAAASQDHDDVVTPALDAEPHGHTPPKDLASRPTQRIERSAQVPRAGSISYPTTLHLN